MALREVHRQLRDASLRSAKVQHCAARGTASSARVPGCRFRAIGITVENITRVNRVASDAGVAPTTDARLTARQERVARTSMGSDESGAHLAGVHAELGQESRNVVRDGASADVERGNRRGVAHERSGVSHDRHGAAKRPAFVSGRHKRQTAAPLHTYALVEHLTAGPVGAFSGQSSCFRVSWHGLCNLSRRVATEALPNPDQGDKKNRKCVRKTLDTGAPQ